MTLEPSPVPRSVAQAIRILHLDVITAQAVRAFREAGIGSILLKGPALARWLYDDEAERFYVDVDLLVRPQAAAEAERLLASLGLRRAGLELIPNDWPRHAVVYRTDDGATVDLHHTLVGVGVDGDRLWEELSARTEQIRVGGETVDVLEPPARALVVVLHAAKDGGRVAKARIDAERCVARLESRLWPGVAELARRVRAEPALAAGLRSVPAGADLAHRLGLPNEVPVEVAIRSTGKSVPPLATGIDWLLTSQGVGGKLKLVIRKMFPPADYLREWKPLARRGTWGLALAYVWRPLWVAAHVVPALAAVIRAHRAAARSAPRP